MKTYVLLYLRYASSVLSCAGFAVNWANGKPGGFRDACPPMRPKLLLKKGGNPMKSYVLRYMRYVLSVLSYAGFAVN